MGDNLPAVDLGTGRTARQIAAGQFHTCALLDNNAVKCWGLSPDGQLGQGDTRARGDGQNEMGDYLPVVDLGTP
jgi:alpha-tubulin suppressor-like RCC1 family protein